MSGRFEGLLAAWHENRAPILGFAVCVFLSVCSIIRRRRSQLQKQTESPLSCSPALRPAGSEKSGWPSDGIEKLPKVDGVILAKEKTEDARILEIDILKAPKSRPAPKRVTGSKRGKSLQSLSSNGQEKLDLHLDVKPIVFFSSLTGSTERYVKKLVANLSTSLSKGQSSRIREPQLLDLSYIDYDDYFVTPPKSSEAGQNTAYFYLLVVPTYNIDTILNNFLAHLQETHHDFRIDTAPLSGLLGYSVFGFGDREGWPTEEKGFCSQAREVDKWMAKLTGRRRAFPLGMGDVGSDGSKRLEEWRLGVEEVLQSLVETGQLGEGAPGSGDAVESDEEDLEIENPGPTEQEGQTLALNSPRKRRKLPAPPTLDDLEDIGRKAPIPIDFTTSSASTSTSTTPTLPAMVPTTSPTYTALAKQGYTIIGSHSGVKICRWTKSALRGRGSCYKHSFYDIASHLCMETTPSLSCSNKCVFCWRHGTNPVGTTWRWQVDPPEIILNGALEGHYKKIRMMRGVPGVRAERFAEAMRVRHCALSLVGEPIFYPHINAFLALLHAKRISSFLVCNAQHPDQLAALTPVTQLYVSIDASNRDSLRTIDRPLHRDFWERFQRCLDILREKRFSQRTVFRLTLVKGFNIDDEVDGYADLVARGLPCFVEIKGVTYCGTSTSSSAGLTMQNVPFYTEVVAFVEALNTALEKRGLDYGIAAEHAHSCCVLLASKRFFVEGKWHTLIDYEKFFECLERGGEFQPEDYMGGETPEWATWGRGGFDPRDERVDRKGRPVGGGGGGTEGTCSGVVESAGSEGVGVAEG
ncbi:hypothetical protein MMC30_007830 [Trapelia coarctata]|nr:hypothetical protein [Trapelia coarctata]